MNTKIFNLLRKNLHLAFNLPKYAGISIDTFDKLSSTISKKVNGSLTDSKVIFSTLVASGKFTNESMASVGEAIARVTKLSGESADTVTKELMPAFNGTASAVAALNDKYHFLTLEQYKNLEVLEKQGKYQKLAKDASDALNESLKKHEENLGTIEQMWKNIKDFINEAAESAKKIGRKETRGDEVAELQAQLKYAESVNLGGINQARVDALTKALDIATSKAEKEKKDLEEASAKTAANVAKKPATSQALVKTATGHKFLFEIKPGGTGNYDLDDEHLYTKCIPGTKQKTETIEIIGKADCQAFEE
mgnify:CR=1 FL=1